MAIPQPEGSSYIFRQAIRDFEYELAWKNAPQEFKEAAAKFGLSSEASGFSSTSVPYDQGYSTKDVPYDPDFNSRAYTPNMADLVDDYVDEVIERVGTAYGPFIRALANLLKKPMDLELIRNRAHLLSRLAAYLVRDENGKEKSNALARIHAMLHAIPRLATENGFGSMRASAVACGVSPEWLRKSRDKCCEQLEIDAPAHSQKSSEARAKYKLNAQTNHWRGQLYIAPKPSK